MILVISAVTLAWVLGVGLCWIILGKGDTL